MDLLATTAELRQLREQPQSRLLAAEFKRRAVRLDEALAMLAAYATIPIREADVPLPQAVELCSELGTYAYDAYVICCALNQRSPLLTLDGGLAARAKERGVRILEVGVS